MIFDDSFYIKNCWINLYKPSGITSSACTFKIRHILTDIFRKSGILIKNEKLKCGHMGTLDPMAEGILPIAVGLASKIIPLHENRVKSYIFTVNWGTQTDTDDAYGNIINWNEKVPSDNEIQTCIKSFIGEISQIPSKFSAIHINGKRAYDLARAGQLFTLPKRTIIIDSLKLIRSWSENQDAQKNYSEFIVTCSTGTYVRTLAHDIADKLGTFGHLVKLIRISNGVFDTSNCINYQNFLDFCNYFLDTEGGKSLDSFAVEGVRFLDFLKPIDYKLDDIPVIFITETYIFDKFMNGCVIDLDSFDGFYKVYLNLSTLGNKYFIGFANIGNGKMYPRKVFNILKKD